VGLYLNMLRSAATAVLASYAYRKAGRIPRWIVVATLVGFWAVAEYHVHQSRFVREIDRAWRARQADDSTAD